MWMLEFTLADLPPILLSSGQEWQFQVSIVTAHISRSTGSSTPHQVSTDALHTTTPTARSSLNSGFLLLLELQKSLLISFQGCQS